MVFCIVFSRVILVSWYRTSLFEHRFCGSGSDMVLTPATFYTLSSLLFLPFLVGLTSYVLHCFSAYNMFVLLHLYYISICLPPWWALIILGFTAISRYVFSCLLYLFSDFYP
jgi:hypothetical protein